MKVLHFVPTYLPVTSNWIYPQVAGLPGVESRVFCRAVSNLAAFPLPPSSLLLSPPPPQVGRGLPLLFNRLAARVGWPDAVAELRLRAWKPDLLHAHFGPSGWDALRFHRRLRRPLITSFYGYDAWLSPQEHPIWRERYRELFDAGEAFLVEGDAMRRRLVELGCPPGKVRIHRIGIDVAATPFAARNFRGPLKIIMVGRFIEKKGLADGLQACAQALERGTDLTVTIVGGAAPEHPESQAIDQELHALAGRRPLAGRVRFTGFLSLPVTRGELRAHDVFLCPSRHSRDGDAEGGSPVALTEAMAMGLLCVGTDHCDIPALVRDGETGRLCAEKDVDALAGILAGLAGAPEKLAELTHAGRALVEREFSLATQLGRAREIYAEIARGTPAPQSSPTSGPSR